ncbi:MAG: hypothetical protein AAGD38_22520 [Acidobacteriota bacterium]
MRRFLVVLALMLVLPAVAAAQQYVYAVKYVCGYNASAVGQTSAGVIGGEPIVKFGNYATDINILNANDFPVDIEKNFYLLAEKTDVKAREPEQVPPAGFDGISLDPRGATVDDCVRIYEVLNGGAPPPVNPPITVGWVVLRSSHEIDVTAVYTAAICTDYQANGGPVGSCRPGVAQGAGLSIDVEQIEGRRIN